MYKNDVNKKLILFSLKKEIILSIIKNTEAHFRIVLFIKKFLIK